MLYNQSIRLNIGDLNGFNNKCWDFRSSSFFGFRNFDIDVSQNLELSSWHLFDSNRIAGRFESDITLNNK